MLLMQINEGPAYLLGGIGEYFGHVGVGSGADL